MLEAGSWRLEAGSFKKFIVSLCLQDTRMLFPASSIQHLLTLRCGKFEK
jgi:hypothetical protein